MARVIAVRPFASKMHGQHAIRSHLPQWPGGYSVREHAVDQQASTNLYRQEHSWIGATGTYRIDQRSGMKHYALSGGKIRSRHGQGDAQFFERLDLQEVVQKSNHALIAGEAVTRERPTGNMLEAYPGGNMLEFRRRDSAAVGGADESAHTGPSNAADGDVFFFEDFENTDVRDAASKPATQSETDAHAGLVRPRGRGKAGKPTSERLHRTNNLTQTLHGEPHPSQFCPARLFLKYLA